MDMVEKVAIQWTRFGPYHLARLDAIHDLLQQDNIQVVAVETASIDKVYQWEQEVDETRFTKSVVFPDHVYEQIPAKKRFTSMYAQLDKLDPDIVAIAGYSTSEAIGALLWSKVKKRPAILMSASKEDDAPRTYAAEKFKQLIVKQFSSALCGGELQKAYLAKLGLPAHKIFLGYNAVNNDYFHENASKIRLERTIYPHLPGLHLDTPFFLASARFVKRKNFERLLMAYLKYRHTLKQNFMPITPWRLVLLGDGEEKANLEHIIKTENIPDVTLAGFQQIGKLPFYYALASVFIHPAEQEQWGLVVNEAMASGLPVLVSSRCGCAPELVYNDLNGYQFDPENVEELANHMLAFTTNQYDLTRMSQASFKIIEEWGPKRFAVGMYQAIKAAISSQ